VVPFTLCVTGYDSTAYADAAVAAKLTTGVGAFLTAADGDLSGIPINLVRATAGCDAPPSSGRRIRRAALAAVAPTAGVAFRAFAPTPEALAAIGALLRSLSVPTSSSATTLLGAVQGAGLAQLASIWIAGVTSADPALGVILGAAAAAAGQPTPPSPPPTPPYPPLTSAPPGARGGAGGAKNRAIKVTGADGAGAAIGYTLAAIVVLWMPFHMCFHAATAAHVRRTNVTFAVALQCRSALAHGASDVHVTFAQRTLSRRRGTSPGPGTPRSPSFGDAHEAEIEGAEAFVLRGRRFAAPGLAEAAAAFFAERSAGGVASVRPVLRSPLLAALGGAGHKGQDAASLAARRKPKGAWKRLKRALHSELQWHTRAWHHAARGIKRCFTPRFTAEARAAGHGAGHAFRLVPGASWLDESAPSTAALFEVCVEFGWRGRIAATAFRAQLRDAAHLQAFESGFASVIAAAEAASADAADPKRRPLGVSHAGIALLALLDDEPYARLDAKLSRKVAASSAPDVEAPSQLGLSAPVAERLGIMLQLCLKQRDAATPRGSSWFGQSASSGDLGGSPSTPEAAAAPTRAYGLATQGGDAVVAMPMSAEQRSAELAAADVPAEAETQPRRSVAAARDSVASFKSASSDVDQAPAQEDAMPPAEEAEAAPALASSVAASPGAAAPAAAGRGRGRAGGAPDAGRGRGGRVGSAPDAGRGRGGRTGGGRASPARGGRGRG
jgi:hypothetical protein